MNSHQKRTIQAFRRVQGWLRARAELQATVNGAAASNPSPLTQQIGELDSLIERFATHAAAQDGAVRSAKGATEEARRLRVELLKHQMQHIADIAKAAIPDVVQVTAAFRMSTTPRDSEGLIAAGEAMAKAGEQYQGTLVARGLAPDFVAQLRATASAFRSAIDARGQWRANRRGAGEGMNTAVDDGRKLVLSLSVMVKQRLRADSAALAEWHQLKRVTLQGVRGHIAAAVPAAAGPVSETAAPQAQSAAPEPDASQKRAA